jgi:hypothetical protein
MGGFLFRFGVSLKDLGERLKWGWLVRRGLRVRDFFMRRGVFENGKLKIK